MAISMYAASVPVIRQMLNSLSEILRKAENHVSGKKIEPVALLDARLFPDMFPLTRQVQIASDFAKGIAARLAGVEVPSHEDTEQSFSELRERIAKTLAFVDSIAPEQIDGSEERDIVVFAGTAWEKRFSGMTYLLHYGMPQLFFHVTTAYAILRHNGVDIGKRDFVGTF